jgi:hypothetical protein
MWKVFLNPSGYLIPNLIGSIANELQPKPLNFFVSRLPLQTNGYGPVSDCVWQFANPRNYFRTEDAKIGPVVVPVLSYAQRNFPISLMSRVQNASQRLRRLGVTSGRRIPFIQE